jgi:hypothetical protein
VKKIFESHANGWDEVAEIVHIYTLEEQDDNLYYQFEDMSHEEKCELFDVFDESGYYVAPGAIYKTYSFSYTAHHIIMYEKIHMNV